MAWATGGYAAAIKLNNMAVTSVVALGNGMSNFSAQNMGAVISLIFTAIFLKKPSFAASDIVFAVILSSTVIFLVLQEVKVNII